MQRSFYAVNNVNYHPRILSPRQRQLGGYMTRFNQKLALDLLKYGSIPCLKKDESVTLFRISFDSTLNWNIIYKSVEFVNNIPRTPTVPTKIELINVPQITECGELLIKDYHENVCKQDSKCLCHL
jgi:hypothetical protein